MTKKDAINATKILPAISGPRTAKRATSVNRMLNMIETESMQNVLATSSVENASLHTQVLVSDLLVLDP